MRKKTATRRSEKKEPEPSESVLAGRIILEIPKSVRGARPPLVPEPDTLTLHQLKERFGDSINVPMLEARFAEGDEEFRVRFAWRSEQYFALFVHHYVEKLRAKLDSED